MLGPRKQWRAGIIAVALLAICAPSAWGLTAPGGNGIIQITWGTNGSQTFNYTGAMQQFVVPAGVSRLRVQASGPTAATPAGSTAASALASAAPSP